MRSSSLPTTRGISRTRKKRWSRTPISCLISSRNASRPTLTTGTDPRSAMRSSSPWRTPCPCSTAMSPLTCSARRSVDRPAMPRLFLQLGRNKHKAVSKSKMTTKRRAADLLRKVASETNDTGLSALAVMVQLDAFTKVKQAINDMITQLNKEQEEEQKHKDFCVAELDQNQRQATNADNDKANYQSELDQLDSKIKAATKEIDDATAEINDLKIEMGRATDDRNEANNEFQQTVADQRATQSILKKVADRLGQVYQSLVQTSTTVDTEAAGEPGAETPAAPPAMKDYAQQDGGKVVGMLQSIIQDARELEAKTVQAEKDEQAAYEKYMRDSNKEIGAKQRFVTDKSEERATYKAERAQTQADLKEALNDIDKLAAYRTQLHKDCDDTLDNFDMRQDARQSEIDALGQAKNILSGSTE
mmetsp:Transcript_30080/g.77476  ORF Transcript_30080/g.77476 Transcript_30080/m.77476 type:complete len:418 (+) Transcript_30080:885-2138(+)